jgi:hypothetical protein
LERIFAENFNLQETGPRAKENTEITSPCLQSVDDLEATCLANITETCDPENESQLITKVQVAPNNVDDGQLLAEAPPNLKERSARRGFFFCFFCALVTLPAGFQPEFQLFKEQLLAERSHL